MKAGRIGSSVSFIENYENVLASVNKDWCIRKLVKRLTDESLSKWNDQIGNMGYDTFIKIIF